MCGQINIIPPYLVYYLVFTLNVCPNKYYSTLSITLVIHIHTNLNAVSYLVVGYMSNNTIMTKQTPNVGTHNHDSYFKEGMGHHRECECTLPGVVVTHE